LRACGRGPRHRWGGAVPGDEDGERSPSKSTAISIARRFFAAKEVMGFRAQPFGGILRDQVLTDMIDALS